MGEPRGQLAARIGIEPQQDLAPGQQRVLAGNEHPRIALRLARKFQSSIFLLQTAEVGMETNDKLS